MLGGSVTYHFLSVPAMPEAIHRTREDSGRDLTLVLKVVGVLEVTLPGELEKQNSF